MLNILKYKLVIKMVFSFQVLIKKKSYLHYLKSYINNLAFLNDFCHIEDALSKLWKVTIRSISKKNGQSLVLFLHGKF